MNEDKRLELKKEIAKGLLDIEAVFLRPEDPFTWASGIKSPIYCDNRLILTAPKVRDKVEQAIADVVKEEYPEAEVLMGTSTAGIAHAAIAASILDMPMCVPVTKIMAEETGSRADCCRVRRWSLWRI